MIRVYLQNNWFCISVEYITKIFLLKYKRIPFIYVRQITFSCVYGLDLYLYTTTFSHICLNLFLEKNVYSRFDYRTMCETFKKVIQFYSVITLFYRNLSFEGATFFTFLHYNNPFVIISIVFISSTV